MRTAATTSYSTLFERSGRFIAWLVGAVVATGSLVLLEPAPYDILVLLSLGVLFLLGLRFPRACAGPLFLLGLFVIANLLSAATAVDPTESIRSLSIRIYMVLAWIFFVSVLSKQTPTMLTALWNGYLLAAILAVTLGTLEYLGILQGEAWEAGMRAKGAFKDPNVFGPFLVPPAIFAVRRIAGGSVREVWLFTAILIFITFGILLSFSRGAWINFAVSGTIFALLSLAAARGLRVRLKWLTSSVGAAFLLVGMFAAAISVDVIGDRFFQRAVLIQKYDSKVGGRFDTQRQVVAHIGQDPIGVGPGRSDEEFGLEPHNLYLHVFVESGWLGGLALLAFIGLTGFRLLQLLPHKSVYQPDVFLVFACLSGLLAQSLFIDSTHWRHMWLLFAVAWTLITTKASGQMQC